MYVWLGLYFQNIFLQLFSILFIIIHLYLWMCKCIYRVVLELHLLPCTKITHNAPTQDDLYLYS